MAVAADREHAWAQMAAFRQHDMADTLLVVEVVDASVAHPVTREADDLAALIVVGRHVVVGDHDHLRGIPNFGAETLEHRLHAPRPTRVVHHREIYLARDDLARRYPVTARGARHQLLRQGHHRPSTSAISFQTFWSASLPSRTVKRSMKRIPE